MTKPVASLPDRLGVPFRDLALLRGALMHHSYRYERPADAATHPDTQRLEFLGDAVVNMIATRMVFHAFPSADEGTMTRLRSALIRTENLAAIARVYALGEYVILSKGEEHAGGRNRVSLLADVCESVLAAMYLEHGLTVVHEFLAPHFVPHLEQLRASGTVDPQLPARRSAAPLQHHPPLPHRLEQRPRAPPHLCGRSNHRCPLRRERQRFEPTRSPYRCCSCRIGIPRRTPVV